MNAKFKRTPWFTDGGTGYGDINGQRVKDQHGLILAVAIGDVLELDAKANAHLIAAAPDMYAAAAPIAELGEGFSGSDETYISVTAGELRALAAALAKARGETA